MSRLSATQAQALVRSLSAVEAAGKARKSTFSLPAAWDMLADNASASDKSEIAAIRNSAGSFDRESIAILVRDAFLSGMDDDGMSMTLTQFKEGGKPFGENRVPERNIIDNLSRKMSNTGAEAFRSMVAKLEKKRVENKPNYGFFNAELILVAELDSDKKDAFVSDWKKLDYSDKEAILSIIRDAFLGGLEDL